MEKNLLCDARLLVVVVVVVVVVPPECRRAMKRRAWPGNRILPWVGGLSGWQQSRYKSWDATFACMHDTITIHYSTHSSIKHDWLALLQAGLSSLEGP